MLTQANRVLFCVTVVCGLMAPSASSVFADDSGRPAFTLTILHNNDGESSLLPREIDGVEYGGIARFVTKVRRERFRAMRNWDPGESRRRGVVTLNSGDNFLAGPIREVSNAAGIDYDARAVRLVRYDALGIGNHEFDFGSLPFARFAEAVQPRVGFLPLVSANLDYSNDPATDDLRQLVRSTYVWTRRGERIGVVGLTVATLREISSPGLVEVVQDLAAIAQDEIDALTAQGIDKIVLVSHLQGIQSEMDLVALLQDVDVVIGGGGDEILARPGDRLVPGDDEEVFGTYPQIAIDADGNEVSVVTTPGNYRYVGVLQVTFDGDGKVIGIDEEDSGLAIVDETVRATRLALAGIERPVSTALAELESLTVATTEVVLDNSRAVKRVREANVGNLIADAHLAGATEQATRLELPMPEVFFMNGGGIRGEDLDIPIGAISVADTFSLQPFGNFVSIAEDVDYADVRAIVENGLASGVGVQDGGFIQVSRGTRVVIDADGAVSDLVLANGAVVVSDGITQAGTATIAQLNFSIRGGDGQPDLSTTPGVTVTQTPLGDQVSLRRYLESIGTVSEADYPSAGEGRILFDCGNDLQQDACQQ